MVLILCAFVVMSVVIHCLTSHIGRGDQTNYMLGVMPIVQIAVIPLYRFLSRRTSKRTAFSVGTRVSICIMLTSSARGILLVSQANSLAGYRPPEAETVDGAVRSVQRSQTATFLLTLRLISALVPVVLVADSTLGYRLSPALYRRLEDLLDRRRRKPVDTLERARPRAPPP